MINSEEESLLINFSIDLFNKIKHGDQEHQDWLEKEIIDFTKKYIKEWNE